MPATGTDAERAHHSVYDLAAIAEAAADALRAESERLDRANDPRGLDAPRELGLHPLIAAGLERAGFGVFREVRYPAGAAKHKRSAGDRCDLVLTPSPEHHLADTGLAGTLYATAGVPPERACWIEVKTVRQFALVSGVASERPGYASRLAGPAARDLRKLAADPAIRRAASMIVLFARDEQTANHDLAAWAHRALDRGLPAGDQRLRGFPVADRLGNAWCAVAVTAVRSI